MTKKLGVNQLGCLKALIAHGSWHGGGWGCGWVWSTTSGTELILDSLVKRGLASKNIERMLSNRTAMVWRPTEKGRALVVEPVVP